MTQIVRSNGAAKVAPVEPAPSGQMDRDYFLAWVLDAADPRKGKRQCVVFRLEHYEALTNQTRVLTEMFMSKQTRSEAERTSLAQHIVDSFDRASKAWTTQAPSVQTFVFVGVASEDPDARACCQQQFCQTPPDRGDLPEGTERPADLVSVVGQLQREKDTLMREHGRMADRIMDLNERLLDHTNELRTRSWDQQVRMEQLLDDRMRRETEAMERRMRAELEHQVLTMGLDMGMRVGGAILSKKFGISITDPLEAVKLRPDQMLRILGTLDPAQRRMMQPVICKVLRGMTEDQRRELAESPAMVELFQMPPAQIASAGEPTPPQVGEGSKS